MDEIRETALPSNLPNGRKLTEKDYARLPEGGAPYQLIGGELVLTPAPILYHQDVAMNLGGRMRAFVRSHHCKKSLLPSHRGEQEVYQPDIMFVSSTYRKGILTKRRVEGAPDLVVEVLSPAATHFDRNQKFAAHQEYGVLEYWIVDPASKP